METHRKELPEPTSIETDQNNKMKRTNKDEISNNNKASFNCGRGLEPKFHERLKRCRHMAPWIELVL